MKEVATTRHLHSVQLRHKFQVDKGLDVLSSHILG